MCQHRNTNNVMVLTDVTVLTLFGVDKSNTNSSMLHKISPLASHTLYFLVNTHKGVNILQLDRYIIQHSKIINQTVLTKKTEKFQFLTYFVTFHIKSCLYISNGRLIRKTTFWSMPCWLLR